MVATDLHHMSWNRIKTYTDCAEKYRLNYVQAIPQEPQGAFIGGIAVHETVEAIEKDGHGLDILYFTEDFTGPSDASQLFAAKFLEQLEQVEDPELIRWGGRKTKAFPNAQDFNWWMEFGPGMVTRYHKQRLTDELQGDVVLPEFVEVEVNGSWDKDMPVITRIDAMVEDKGGKYWIRDYKTGQRRVEQRLQLALYCIIASETLGFDIAGGELVYLATSNLIAERFECQQYTSAVTSMMDEVITGISGDIFPMSPSGYCNSCAVRSACAWGKTLEPKEEASG